MKKILRNILVKRLDRKNQAIENLTTKEKVAALIEKLYPYQFENGLIRIGPNGDGGYLVPDDLNDIQACFSPGVDKISEFELWCLKNGMKIYLADKSVDEVNLDVPKGQYNFIKKYVGSTNNESFITMDKWIDLNVSNKDSELLLQMDIEGGEYDTLINISDSLMKRFRILVIEFHGLQKLWNPEFFRFAEIVFNKILQTHLCVHIHPNNCCGIHSRNGIQTPRVAEFTFLRKDRISSSKFESRFPHEFDFDNTINDHITLPKDWYKSS